MSKEGHFLAGAGASGDPGDFMKRNLPILQVLQACVMEVADLPSGLQWLLKVQSKFFIKGSSKADFRKFV